MSERTFELEELIEVFEAFEVLLNSGVELVVVSASSINSTEMLRPSTSALLRRTAVEAAAELSKSISASFERPSEEAEMETDFISPQKEK
jgi:hypothetical protein